MLALFLSTRYVRAGGLGQALSDHLPRIVGQQVLILSGLACILIGGFSGGDDSPTLAQFQQYVHDGQVRYFLAREDRGGGGPGGFGGGADSAGSQITDWVQANFTFQTVDGITVYDLQD